MTKTEKPKVKANEMKTMRDLWSRWYGKALIGIAAFLAIILVAGIAFSGGKTHEWEVASKGELKCSTEGCMGDMAITTDAADDRLDAAVEEIRSAYGERDDSVSVGYVVSSPNKATSTVTCSKRAIETIDDTESARTLCGVSESTSSTAGAANSSSKSEPSAFDRPTAKERTVLVQALTEVDPRMGQKIDRYIDRSINTCKMIQDNPWSEERFITETAERFSGGTMPDFTRKQANDVLISVRSNFCDPPRK